MVVELSDAVELPPPPPLELVVSFVAAASEDELIPLDPVSVSGLVEDLVFVTVLVLLAMDPVGFGAGVAAVAEEEDEDLSSLASAVAPPDDPLLVDDVVVDTLSSSEAVA